MNTQTKNKGTRNPAIVGGAWYNLPGLELSVSGPASFCFYPPTPIFVQTGSTEIGQLAGKGVDGSMSMKSSIAIAELPVSLTSLAPFAFHFYHFLSNVKVLFRGLGQSNTSITIISRHFLGDVYARILELLGSKSSPKTLSSPLFQLCAQTQKMACLFCYQTTDFLAENQTISN